MRGPAMLEIHLAGAMTYVVDALPDEVVERRAACASEPTGTSPLYKTYTSV